MVDPLEIGKLVEEIAQIVDPDAFEKLAYWRERGSGSFITEHAITECEALVAEARSKAKYVLSALERLGGEGKGSAQSHPCGDAKSAAPDAEGSGWRPIESAPIQVEGHLWCAELSSLTNATGFTVRAPGGGVDVVSTWRGWHFTHWHPLPEPPTEVERRSPAVAP